MLADFIVETLQYPVEASLNEINDIVIKIRRDQSSYEMDSN
jgi:hypothetical protein